MGGRNIEDGRQPQSHQTPGNFSDLRRGDITPYTYIGIDICLDPAILRNVHVVVTTYDVVKSEYEVYNSLSAKDEAKTTTKKGKAPSSDDEDSADSAEHFGRTLVSKAKKSTTQKKSALFQVKWWRIVLGMLRLPFVSCYYLHVCITDEAHNIKNEKTKGAVACCELQGKFRWCLTGTPM